MLHVERDGDLGKLQPVNNHVHYSVSQLPTSLMVFVVVLEVYISDDSFGFTLGLC